MVSPTNVRTHISPGQQAPRADATKATAKEEIKPRAVIRVIPDGQEVPRNDPKQQAQAPAGSRPPVVLPASAPAQPEAAVSDGSQASAN